MWGGGKSTNIQNDTGKKKSFCDSANAPFIDLILHFYSQNFAVVRVIRSVRSISSLHSPNIYVFTTFKCFIVHFLCGNKLFKCAILPFIRYAYYLRYFISKSYHLKRCKILLVHKNLHCRVSKTHCHLIRTLMVNT